MNALSNANITDEQPCSGSTPSAFPRVKSANSGVSVEYARDPAKRWYVFRALYGQARKATDYLIEDGTYAYLAMVWRDIRKEGKRRRVLRPLLNLVFAYVTPSQARQYIEETPMLSHLTYYYNHFVTIDGKNPPLTVSESDMLPLVRATILQDEHVMAVTASQCRFLSNDRVRVTEGPFQGIEGRVARISRQQRVVIHLQGIDTLIATAYIPTSYLEKI